MGYSATQQGLPNQHRMKWWNEMPAFWKRDTAKPLVDESKVEGKESEAVCQKAKPETEGERYAEGVEEIPRLAHLRRQPPARAQRHTPRRQVRALPRQRRLQLLR